MSCYLGSNLLLHADHHYHPTKGYEDLVAIKGAIIMPYTYSVMAPLALIPPLYMRIVNPIIEEYKKKKM